MILAGKIQDFELQPKTSSMSRRTGSPVERCREADTADTAADRRSHPCLHPLEQPRRRFMRFREATTVAPGDGCRGCQLPCSQPFTRQYPRGMRGIFLRVISRIGGRSDVIPHASPFDAKIPWRRGRYSILWLLRHAALRRTLLVGRYVSVGPGVRAFRRNHTLDRASMHPYFYNTALGIAERETVPPHPLVFSTTPGSGPFRSSCLAAGASGAGR